MMALEDILSQEIVQKLGWTLLHFVWQAAVAALLLSVLLRVLRKSAANLRYVLACLTLGLIVLLPVVTLHLVPISASYPTALVEPAPVPSVLPMEETKQVPVAEMPVLEKPVQLVENVAITPKVSWKQRTVELLEPALPYIVSGWLVGVFGLSLWHLGGWTQMQRLRRRMVKQIGPPWQSKLKELAKLLGIRRIVQLMESALVRVPTVVGWLRPVILLPASALTGLSTEQLEAILAHELAHIRRYDYFVNMLQTVVEILGFYHPAVWWVSRKIRVERENCCDDLAVRVSGDRVRYARALTSLEEVRSRQGELAVAATGGSLLARICRLVGKESANASRVSWIPSVIAILLILAFVIPTTLALNSWSKTVPNELEAKLIQGFRENRDKFECGVLAWSRKSVNDRYSDSNDPRRELAGQYKLWWDGKKIATKYIQDQVYTDPTGRFWVDKQQGGNSYDGSLLSRKPRFNYHENWLGPVTRWRGDGSLDKLILGLNNLKHITKDWSVVDANGVKLIRVMTRNMNETARDYGAYSIRDYDPSKGYGLVNEEWYNPDGSPRLKHTVKMLEVISGGWFPVEIDFKSFTITDGRVYNHSHYALDIERCSFNDRSALPKGIFKLGMEKQLKYQEKLQKYLAMELEGLSDVKEIEKADKVKRGAREAIETFVAAALAGDFEKASEFAPPDKLSADHIMDLNEMAEGQNLWIMAVVADDWSAMAVSSVIQGDHSRMGPLVFCLDRIVLNGRDNWWVHDIDMETPDRAEVELKQFLKEHPEAKKVPSENKTDVQISASELVAKIIESEKKIKDIQLHMTCTIPARNHTFYEFDWGYEHGKEFYSGIKHLRDSRTETYETVKITQAFDGEKRWLLRVDPDAQRPGGGILEPDYTTFRGMMTFNTLLGFDAKELGRLSFAEAIAQAESISVRDKVEFIDGHPCYVIEAINLETDPSVDWAYDVRAWIDYQRDYRLLKFEKYRSISGKNRFKVVSRQVDNIKLKKIDGIWLPIQGDRTSFSTNVIRPPKGMTRAQFAALPTEEREQVGVFKLTPMVPTRRLEIDVESIRLNKGIPAERFTIVFPDGCEVYDEFTSKRYVVGEPSEQDAGLSDAELIEQMAGLSVSELIDILRKSSIGRDKKKWFAAVHRLVEIGSAAVPELVAELRRTGKPQTQSKLALTLRAIGDLSAVPGLIDSLERSGFSSDYGIGEPKTELDIFFKRHQMDPAKEGLGLGRPVREITIALEKLTGHTEGHDHFYAYDSKGNRLGSHIITPEIRDRQREHRRQVAQRWRQWWQENQGKIKPPDLPQTQPTQVPVQKAGKKREYRVLAAPEGAMLTLAIVPNADGSGRQPSLTTEEYQRYLDDLAENGPLRGSIRGDSFQWSPIKGGLNRFRGLPLSTYKERTYILLCARTQYVMIPEFEGRWVWGLEKVQPTTDAAGRPAISLQFDEKGAELFYELTKANIGNHLAIGVDSWVLSAPVIETPLSKKAIIAGDLTKEQVRSFVEDLRKGMPPVKTDVQVEVETPDEKIPLVWGEAVEGVQMRVRPERQRWYEGETPRFRVDMRNKGTVEWELGLTHEHWEVELDGLWHRVGALFSGYFRTLLFGPGQEHKDIEFYPGVWSEWNSNGRPLKFTPGLHTVRLSFGPSTRDRANWRRLRVVSNAVVIEVLPAEADKRGWGEAVAGLQCGLRADKRLWKADETPRLQAVARNVGRGPWRLPRPSELFYLKVAGKIWRWKGPVSDRPADLEPREALDKTTILLSEDWVGAYGSDLRLKLSLGKHAVQLVMFVSDPVPPEAVPGTIPIPKHLRIESNVVVVEVLPDGEKADTVDVEADASTSLQAELHELWQQRQDLAGAEAFGKRLLEKYTEREEQALIYCQLAEIYAQSGQINPSKTIEYARAGWWYLHDAVKKARLFVYWGDALQLSKGRRDAAKIYLRGLEFCLQFGLPKDKPELPAVGVSTVDGPPEVVEKYRKENEQEMVVRRHAERIGELVEHRQALTGQIVQLYAREPDAFDELRELVMKYLHSEEAAEELIAAARAYRRNQKVAIPVIMRMGPDPKPDADLLWGQAAEGIRVRLRAEKGKWAAGETPKFKVDVRNDGSHRLLLTSAPDYWGVEVNGVWYRVTIPMLGGAKGMSFGPDKRWYNLELSLDMALGSQNENGGFELAPGWHTVRAALSRGLSQEGRTISLRVVSNPVEIEILPAKTEVKDRLESAEKLKELGNALLIYANDHEEKYPDTLQKLQKHINDMSEDDLKWLLENVVYLGRGKTVVEPPDTVIAYDKTLLEKGEGTNVLFNDSHVTFKSSKQLEKLGISKRTIQIESRFLVVSEGFLEDVGLDANSIQSDDVWSEHLVAESPALPISESYSLILDDLHVSFLIKAVQAHEDSKMLAAPKVTVLDGQEAAFSIHRQVNYISGYSEPNRPSGEPIPERDSVNKGLQLQVTPKITPDNRHILLNVGFELSDLLGFEERMYKEKYPYKIPQMEVVSAKTRVLVPNGGTVLMGGQKVTAEEDGRKVQKELLVLIKAEKVDSEDLPTYRGGYGGYGGFGGSYRGGYGGYGGYGGILPEEMEDPNSPDANSPENRP